MNVRSAWTYKVFWPTASHERMALWSCVILTEWTWVCHLNRVKNLMGRTANNRTFLIPNVTVLRRNNSFVFFYKIENVLLKSWTWQKGFTAEKREGGKHTMVKPWSTIFGVHESWCTEELFCKSWLNDLRETWTANKIPDSGHVDWRSIEEIKSLIWPNDLN